MKALLSTWVTLVVGDQIIKETIEEEFRPNELDDEMTRFHFQGRMKKEFMAHGTRGF